jgi:hypothetical protein
MIRVRKQRLEHGTQEALVASRDHDFDRIAQF